MNATAIARNLAIALATTILFACAHQSVVSHTGSGQEGGHRPDWTLTPPESADGKVFFTGRALADNVLDERKGINEAMDDAIAQIAKAAGASSHSVARVTDNRSGEEIRGDVDATQKSDREVRIEADGLVVGTRQEDTFWDRYEVREEFLGKEIVRYRFFVLVSIPETELKRLEEVSKKKRGRN